VTFESNWQMPEISQQMDEATFKRLYEKERIKAMLMSKNSSIENVGSNETQNDQVYTESPSNDGTVLEGNEIKTLDTKSNNDNLNPEKESTEKDKEIELHPYGQWSRVIVKSAKTTEKTVQVREEKVDDDDESEGELSSDVVKNFKFVEKQISFDDDERGETKKSTTKVQFKKRKLDNKGTLRDRKTKFEIE